MCRLDEIARAIERETAIRLARHASKAKVKARRKAPVERDFPFAHREAPVARREIEIGQAHWTLHLEDPVLAQQDGRYMGLHDLRRAESAGEKIQDLFLVLVIALCRLHWFVLKAFPEDARK